MNVAHRAQDKTRLGQRCQIAALQVETTGGQRGLGSALPRQEESEMQDGAGTTADGAGTHVIRKLATVLLAALALFAFQLVRAQTSSAATGLACPQTGMETVASDAGDYPPGSTAVFSGTGYAPDCDIQLNVSRPDGVTDTVSATTDLLGNFSADYPLPPPPGVIGPYHLDVLGYAGLTLASMDFTDANKIDADVSPAYDPGNSTTTFSVLIRNTDGNAVYQNVRVTLPAGYTNISVPSVTATDGTTQTNPSFSSGTWGAPVVNQAARTVQVALSSGSGLAAGSGWARIDITATTPATLTGNPDQWTSDCWY